MTTSLIKEKLNLVDLIAGYIQLKPAGSGNWKAVCPFHNEKTPSLHVSSDKQLWHCFGCAAGGDHFAFVMKIEGLDFGEALRQLAERTGVEIPRYQTPEHNERTRLLELLALAARFYASALQVSPGAELARAYAKKRALSDELIAQFGIGYAPAGWEVLTQALRKRGFHDKELVRAGLSVMREKGGGSYDRFRDRLMFPIRDQNGKTIGFTGRVLATESKEAKYINTPQSPLYDKSAVLYGLDLAKQEIRTQGFVIIVEGQMDVIGSWRGGVKNVVASSGTALTERQVAMLARLTSLILLAFDADAAGYQAARRGIDLALGAGLDVKIISLPTNIKDPDECTARAPELWRNAVATAEHLIDFDIRKTRGLKLDDPLIKKRALDAILVDVAKLTDAVERDYWLRRLAEKFVISETALREELTKKLKKVNVNIKNNISNPSVANSRLAPVSRQAGLSQSLIGYISAFPEFRADIFSNIADLMCAPDWRPLYSLLRQNYTANLSESQNNSGLVSSAMRLEDLLQGNAPVSDSLATQYASAAAFVAVRLTPANLKEARDEIVIAIKELKTEFLHEQSQELEKLIRAAELRGDQSGAEAYLNELQKLMK